MAQSAADLRARVHAANQETENAQQALRNAMQVLDTAIGQYRAITDKPAIVQATQSVTSAKERVEEAIGLAHMAIDSANTYAALL